MDNLLLTVADTFNITGRGLVIVPGPLESEYMGPRQVSVLLELPSGEQRTGVMSLEHVFQSPPPKEIRYACLLRGVEKEHVPIGTKVYISER